MIFPTWIREGPVGTGEGIVECGEIEIGVNWVLGSYAPISKLDGERLDAYKVIGTFAHVAS